MPTYLLFDEFLLLFSLDEEFVNFNKLNMIYANSVDAFNSSHKKFNHSFIDEKQQELLIDIALMRLNRPNPFKSNLQLEFDISQCPSHNDQDWIHWPIKGRLKDFLILFT